MPGASVDLGTGATLTFGSSGFSIELTSITWDGIEREIIETSHLGTPPATGNEIGSKTFLAGDLSDPGELSFEGHHNPGEIPPVEGNPELITLTYPLVAGDTTPAAWSAQGQMTSYSATVPLEDKMVASGAVKIVGPITVTQAT